MEQVIDKYKKLAYEDNERKLEALRNNEVKAERPVPEGRGRLRKTPEES